jgi:DNA-binding protein YbaB
MPESLEEIMKMAQNAQAELQKAQDNLDKIEVEGVGRRAGQDPRDRQGPDPRRRIDESLLQPSEKTMVEDLIAAAINDARAKADQAAAPRCRR